MRCKLLLGVLATMGCASVAQAVEPGFYVGAGLGKAGVEVNGNDPNVGDISDIDFDGSDTGWKLLAGYRFMPYFGVEASWNDFGKPDDSHDVLGVPVETEFETDGFDASLMGYLPLGPVDLFARAGWFKWDIEANQSSGGGIAQRFKDNGNDLTYGVGVQGFLFNRLGLRAEYQVYDVSGVNDAYFLSASALLKF
jgi:hypothetical protein